MTKTWHLALSHPAQPPRTKESRTVAWVYAAVLFVMGVTQLITLGRFLQIVHDDYGWSYVAGGWYIGLLIFAELLALPFLLRWRLSTGLRVFSMFLGWVVPLVWLFISGVALVKSGVDTMPFLGGAIGLVPGWWAVFISIALGILAVWASWGLWPQPSKVLAKKRR